MRISLKWLEDHIDVADFYDHPYALADRLTDAGLEVEEVISYREQFTQVVVGQIKKLGKHPDADKLTYCEVDVGDEVLKIICGATNHKEGDKVCVAKIGAVLPGDFKIKKSKIRGVESHGMLCSLSELGLETDKKSEGILILDKELSVGEEFAKVSGLDDVIYEINVTPNRADCLSHLGLAREIATLFDRSLKKRSIDLGSKTEDSLAVTVDIKNSDLCPRYMGQVIKGVKVGPSPKWLVKRLESVGLKSINNVVDVTNFIMFDSGQPLHAFDIKYINGNKITVANSVNEEKFVTLDGTELELTGEELTIRDNKGPIALAGVIGGKNSGVEESTQDIFIEAAHFIPSGVRRTSRFFGIDTDSSYRFSRGTDISRVAECLKEAVALMLEVAGGVPGKVPVDVYPNKKSSNKIQITHAYIDQRLGFQTDQTDVEDVFKRLGFQVKALESGWEVYPADYRWDIFLKEDLVEEVGRVLGYDKIPEELPSFLSNPQKENSLYQRLKSVRNQFLGMGYNEVIHYNFYSSQEEAQWASEIHSNFVSIKNPLSVELSVMRDTLAPQFVSNYIRNYRQGEKKAKIFEIGVSHYKKDGYKENTSLSLGLWQEDSVKAVHMDKLLSDIGNFFEVWGVGSWSAVPEDKGAGSLFHPKLFARIHVEGKDVGFLYSINPRVSKENKIPRSFCGAEIDLDKFLKGKPRPKKFKEFSRQPVVERDFSALVTKDFNYPDVYKKVKKASGPIFKSLSIVDIYEGDKVPEDKLSVTFRGQFQHPEKTLSDVELKELQESILKELNSSFS